MAHVVSSKRSLLGFGLAVFAAACGVRSTLGPPPGETDGQGGAASGSVVVGTSGGGAPDGPGPMTIGAGGTPTPDGIVASSAVVSSSAESVASSAESVASSAESVGVSVVASSSAESVASSSSSGGGVAIACGEATCVGGDVCCLNQQQKTSACAMPGSCGSGSVPLACMGGSDCAMGEVCCAIFQQWGPGPDGYKGASCQTKCENPQFGQLGLTLCTDDPSVCPKGTSCKASAVLPKGFFVCAY